MAALSLSPFSLLEEPSPTDLSCSLLQLLGIRVTVSGRQRIPYNTPIMVVSNHRSALDAPVLMTGLDQDIAFVCHQYMEHVPVLKDVVHRFGAFPLDSPRQLFRQGCQHLRQHTPVGIFPEGARSMVQVQPPRHVSSFHRGFAHLALRAPLEKLALLPVAIVSDDKGFESPIPLSLLGWFDPSEPLFQQGGGHPIVFYRQVEVKVGEPIWVTPSDRQQYQGRHGPEFAQQLADSCWAVVHDLLQER
ncbi:MAG: lysophospholipid acyltransferase family protein [Leptolyngbyaceae cyanobacterium]